jgi:hypothetical protein
MEFTETLAVLLALNGREISVGISGPRDGDLMLAFLYGRFDASEPDVGADVDAAVWTFDLGDDNAPSFFLDESDFIDAYRDGPSLVIRRHSGTIEIEPGDAREGDIWP